MRSLIAIILLVTPGLLRAETAAIGKKRVFGLNLSAGAEQSFWEINAKSQCESCSFGVVDYETEGAGLYRVQGELRVWNGALVRLHHERPIAGSERQDEILRVDESQETGAEKSVLGVALDPIASRYFSDSRISARILKRLLSIKVERSRELFWGNAKASQAATFLPIHAKIDYENLTIDDGVPVSAGDELAFRTEFTDLDLSMALFNFGLWEQRLADCAFRLGYYKARWRRLSDATVSRLSATPLVYEAEFESEGFSLGYESTDFGAPGWNFDLSLKWGVDNSLKSAIDWKRLFGDDLVIQTTMIDAGAWYNFYFEKETRDGFSLTPGIRLDLRKTVVQADPGLFADPFPANESADLIFKYFVTAGWRF